MTITLRATQLTPNQQSPADSTLLQSQLLHVQEPGAEPAGLVAGSLRDQPPLPVQMPPPDLMDTLQSQFDRLSASGRRRALIAALTRIGKSKLRSHCGPFSLQSMFGRKVSDAPKLGTEGYNKTIKQSMWLDCIMTNVEADQYSNSLTGFLQHLGLIHANCVQWWSGYDATLVQAAEAYLQVAHTAVRVVLAAAMAKRAAALAKRARAAARSAGRRGHRVASNGSGSSSDESDGGSSGSSSSSGSSAAHYLTDDEDEQQGPARNKRRLNSGSAAPTAPAPAPAPAAAAAEEVEEAVAQALMADTQPIPEQDQPDNNVAAVVNHAGMKRKREEEENKQALAAAASATGGAGGSAAIGYPLSFLTDICSAFIVSGMPGMGAAPFTAPAAAAAAASSSSSSSWAPWWGSFPMPARVPTMQQLTSSSSSQGLADATLDSMAAALVDLKHSTLFRAAPAAGRRACVQPKPKQKQKAARASTAGRSNRR